MRQVNEDPNRGPMLARKSAEPRSTPDAAPLLHSAHRDDVGSHDRRLWRRSESGIELQYPARLVWPSPWVGHIPFAFWLVEAIHPRVVVELGVHSGNSYCAFLQAIHTLSIPAQCYGIDHWRGDEHSDRYDDDVYAELTAYHDPLYAGFSTLIRVTFEDALPYFAEGSVDLLHIDGYHSFEAVSKDFSEWLPKMSTRGVVLLHDIDVREREFGVWKLWDELTARYPTLAFVHSHGLGVAYVGDDPPPASLRTLLTISDSDTLNRVRSYFARLGMSLVDRFERRQAEAIAGRVQAGEAELQARDAAVQAGNAALQVARAELQRQREAADALRVQVESTTAQVAVLHAELAATRAERAHQIEQAATLRQDLVAARAEAAHQTEVTTRLQEERVTSRTQTAREAEGAARLQRELSAARADIARHGEAAGTLQQELRASQAETARQHEAVAALQRELAISRGETTRAVEATAALQRRLDETCAERARAADGARTEADQHITALREEVRRTQTQLSEALAQRERAGQLLRQQLTATLRMQRELAALRQPQVAAPVDRLTR